MKRKSPLLIALAAVSIAGYVACSGNAAGPKINGNEMLASLASNVAVPTYSRLESQAVILKGALDAFCFAPDASSLDAARQSWRDTQVILMQSEIFGFGPYKDQSFDSRLNFWPTRPANIETAVGSAEDFSQESIDALGVGAKGMPAIEYLLFRGDEIAVLDDFTQEGGSVRCRYLAALGADVIANAAALRQAWAPEGANFSFTFSDAGRSSAVYPTLLSAESEVVNQMAFLVEAVRDTKLGKPAGKHSGGEPRPELVESIYSDNSIANMINDLVGLRSFYAGDFEGAGGLGFYDFIKNRDPFLADLVREEIDRSIVLLQAIPEPLGESVILNPEACEAAYAALTRVKVIISGQVTSLLGVTTFFSGNDGD